MRLWIDANTLRIECIYSGKIEAIGVERVY